MSTNTIINSGYTSMPGIDAPRNDLSITKVNNPVDCKTSCDTNSNCAGYVTDHPLTYVPTSPTDQTTCWLKHSLSNTTTPYPSKNSNRFTYAKQFMGYGGTDSPGNDFKMASPATLSPAECMANCAYDANCKGFATDAAGQKCWLKTSIPGLFPNNDRNIYVKTTNIENFDGIPSDNYTRGIIVVILIILCVLYFKGQK